MTRLALRGRDFRVGESLFRLALVAVPLAIGWKATTIGQDVNFDYFNYHAYDAWAFLHGRIFSDVFPAGSQTLVNPLVDVPTYLLQTNFAPRLAAFIIGFEQGLGPLLVVLIVRRMVRSRLLALAAGVTAAISGGFIAELGNDMGDAIVAPFLLLGVLLAMVALERGATASSNAVAASDVGASEGFSWWTRAVPRSTWWWVCSGLAGGVGAGLKFAELPIGVGIVVASFVMIQRPAARLRAALGTGVGFAAGIVLTAGYWSIELWRHYGDPIAFVGGTFLGLKDPYFPASASATTSSSTSLSLQSFFHFLTAPFAFYLHPTKFSELPVREASLAIAAALLFLLLIALVLRAVASVVSARRRGRGWDSIWRARGYSDAERLTASMDRYLVVVFVVALYIWNRNFGEYRYLIPLELLGPAVIIALGRRLAAMISRAQLRRVAERRVLLPIFLVICVACVLTESPSAYWDRVPFGSTWTSVATPKILDNHKLDILVGLSSPSYPASFVIPLLKGNFIAVGGITGESSLDMRTAPTLRLVHAAFDKVRKAGGTVIGFWRNTASPAGPTTIINELDDIKLRPGRCVPEIMTLGATIQSLVFCRFVPVRT